MKRTKRLPEVPAVFAAVFTSVSKSTLIEIIYQMAALRGSKPIDVAAWVVEASGIEITNPYARGLLAGAKVKK